jgi:hypothetical protein
VGSARDHGVVDGASSVPPPLVQTGPAPQVSPTEEARTLVAATNVAALATLTADGDPWASLITYGALDDGAPALCLSRLAEPGRNLATDPRASLIITQIDRPPDPLAAARVTLIWVVALSRHRYRQDGLDGRQPLIQRVAVAAADLELLGQREARSVRRRAELLDLLRCAGLLARLRRRSQDWCRRHHRVDIPSRESCRDWIGVEEDRRPSRTRQRGTTPGAGVPAQQRFRLR